MKRIWIVRIAAYQPRPFSRRSPHFCVPSFFTRVPVMIMSPMTKRMNTHSPINP